MYLELKRKIREYKSNSDTFHIEPQNLEELPKSLWDYDITLSEDSHPFLSSYIDLSRSAYTKEGFELNENDEKTIDYFEKECYGSDGIVASILYADGVDSDWLNGVFLAQEIISQFTFGQFSASINTWHSGCKSNLLKGFHHFCTSSRYSAHKRIQWDWCGSDVRESSSSNILVGAMGNGDMTIGSNLIYLSNKLKENWRDGADVVFHDIYPKSHMILISGILTSIMFLSNKGYFVCRLPEPGKWDTNTLNIFLTIGMIFKKVHIWCPIWGKSAYNGKRKYYLIAIKKKKTIYKSNYRSFLKLLKFDFSTKKRFLKENVHDNVVDWEEILQNIREEMLENSGEDQSKKVDNWTKIITSNLLPLKKKMKL